MERTIPPCFGRQEGPSNWIEIESPHDGCWICRGGHKDDTPSTLRVVERLVSQVFRGILLKLTHFNTDPRMREIGDSNRENIDHLLRSLALYPFTQRLHMPPESFTSLIAQAQQEAADLSLKAYFPL